MQFLTGSTLQPKHTLEARLAEALEAVIDCHNQSPNRDFRVWWEIARLVALVRDAPDRYGKVTNAQIAKRAGIGIQMLSKAIGLHRDFNARELNELLTARLTWAHVAKLRTVKDRGTRSELVHETEQHNWSPADLEEAIDKRFRRRKVRHRGGRRIKIPRTPVARRQELQRLGRRLLEKFTQIAAELPTKKRNALERACADLKDALENCLALLNS